MARLTFENDSWLPEEHDSDVIREIGTTSAIEAIARRVTMGTDTKSIPRSGGSSVAVVPKGGAYPEGTNDVDDIVMVAKKLGNLDRIAEEDIDDSPIDIINDRKLAWANSYARYLDNACIGVTAAIGAGVPFTSVYRSLSQTNAATGYTANANIVKTAAGAAVSLANLSAVLKVRENSRFFSKAKEVVIASPVFLSVLRDLKDDENRPIFATAISADQPDTLFGYPINWSQGAVTSATATDEPNGNPLLVFGNRDHLILGVRSGPESILIDGRDGTSATTDETLLKMRARRAFMVGNENAFSILEVVPSA